MSDEQAIDAWDFYTARDVADLLGIARSTLSEVEARYEVPVKRGKRNAKLYTDEVVQALQRIRELEVEGAGERTIRRAVPLLRPLSEASPPVAAPVATPEEPQPELAGASGVAELVAALRDTTDQLIEVSRTTAMYQERCRNLEITNRELRESVAELKLLAAPAPATEPPKKPWWRLWP